MDPIRLLREKAKKKLKKIVLPETEDKRILEAGFRIAKEGIARILFITDDIDCTRCALAKLGKYDERAIEVVDPRRSHLFNRLVDGFCEKRRQRYSGIAWIY